MHDRLPLLAAGIFFSGTLCSAAARAQDVATGDEPARPRLVSELAGIVPGRVNSIAIVFDIDEGWHTYWPGQNETGLPVVVDLRLPPGFEAGEILWPAPRRYTSAGDLLDHVYEGQEATLLIPIEAPEDLEPGTEVIIAADLEWMVCREACILGSGSVTTTLPVLPPDEHAKPGDGAERIAAARRRLPVPLPDGANDVTVAWKEGVLVITPERPVESLSFAPHERSARITNLRDAGASEGGPLRLIPETTDIPVVGILEMELGAEARPRIYRIETLPPAD